MFRSRLLSLIRKEAEALGFDFHNGFLYRVTRSSLHFPALWMEPPALTEVQGRDEGMLTYRVTLHLMISDRKYDETQKEQQWETLESQTMELLRSLRGQEATFSIDKIRCTPAEFSLTNRGELSLKTEFDARITFPYESSETEPEASSNT